MSKRKPLAIGIDVGASHFRVALCKGDHCELIKSDTGKEQTPCYARLDGDHQWSIGEAAMHSAPQETARTVFFVKRLLCESIGNVKNYGCLPFIIGEDTHRRKIGLLEPQTNTTRNVSPIEIYSEFLRKAIENAESELRQDRIQYAVITVPDTFTTEQRRAIQNAAQIARLQVALQDDTSAAAMYYLHQTDPGTKKNVLMFDLGGGSFKLSVWHIEKNGDKCKKDFLMSEGNHNLGGFDFDSAIARHVLNTILADQSNSIKQDKKKMWHLHFACKKAREDLTTMKETCIDLRTFETKYRFTFNRTTFKELEEVRDLLSIIRKAIDKIISKQKDISEIVTMGGASNMICIQEIIASCCKGRKINRMLDANETVVFGAAFEAYNTMDLNDDITEDLSQFAIDGLGIEIAAQPERRNLEQCKQDWMEQLENMVVETQDVVKNLKNKGDFDEQCQRYVTWKKENPQAPIQQIIRIFELVKTLKERVTIQQLEECRKIAAEHTLDGAKETLRICRGNCSQNVANYLCMLTKRLCTHETIIKVTNYSIKKKNNETIRIQLSNSYIVLWLEIIANGYRKGEKSYMSLLITTCYCEENQTSCKISLLNQKEDAGHYERTVQLNENSLIIEEFIDNNALTHYIQDDSIVLKLERWLRPGHII